MSMETTKVLDGAKKDDVKEWKLRVYSLLKMLPLRNYKVNVYKYFLLYVVLSKL